MNGESERHIFVCLPCCNRKNAVTFHRYGWDTDRQAVCGRVRCARTFHFASTLLSCHGLLARQLFLRAGQLQPCMSQLFLFVRQLQRRENGERFSQNGERFLENAHRFSMRQSIPSPRQLLPILRQPIPPFYWQFFCARYPHAYLCYACDGK